MTYFIKVFVGTLLLCIGYTTYSQTIIPGGVPGKFGIDGDVKSDTLAFGTSMPAAPGTDDWFRKNGGTGLGIIDTTGAAKAKIKLSLTGDTLLDMPFKFNRFSLQNGNLLLDGRYSRDGAITDFTYFTGSSQNAQDPTTWNGSTSVGSPLDKSDIVDTYIHLRRDGPNLTAPNQSHLFLMLGATIVSTAGSHYLDFELYKERIYYSQPTGKFANSGPTWSGGHSLWEFRSDGSVNEMGDMQISFSFNNTTVTSTNIYIWVSYWSYLTVTPERFRFVPNTFISGTLAGYGYAEITALTSGGTLPIWGQVNSTNIPAPDWGTTSKDIGANGTNYYSAQYAPGQFAELAIDFTALGTDPSFNPYYNPCQPPFTRFIGKTRSSSSITAALKDFTGPYPFVEDYTPPANITPPAHLSCNTLVINLQPDSIKTPGVYEWSTSDGNILTPNKDTPYISINKAGTYVLKTRTYKGCFSRQDSVVIKSDNYKPIASAGGPYYITTSNAVANLQGGNAAASNYLTPFGLSQGLIWNWTGPNNFTSSSQLTNVVDTGTYTLNLTEIRSGCTATSTTAVSFLAPLPLKFMNFSAKKSDNNVLLTWNVTNETNVKYYQVERSSDFNLFSTIGKVNYKATTNTTNTYKYTDYTFSGNNGYRITLVNNDGKISYSDIVFVTTARNLQLQVSPNPVKDEATLFIPSQTERVVTVELQDINGKRVLLKKVEIHPGNNAIALYDLTFSRGTYIVKVYDFLSFQYFKVVLQ
ncbi:MAG TPA: T9SS type A sorting domain-containing protein [Chitinophagaceae bacterium]|nr:T9SS type A sorting domain-containing protein [Chitinophagaceae bacterium]